MQDVANDLAKVSAMIKKDAKRFGIDLKNLEDIPRSPKPQEFGLYREIEKWTDQVDELFEAIDFKNNS